MEGNTSLPGPALGSSVGADTASGGCRRSEARRGRGSVGCVDTANPSVVHGAGAKRTRFYGNS
jgi:hypothetical protein